MSKPKGHHRTMAMKSACGEYECPCHDKLQKSLMPFLKKLATEACEIAYPHVTVDCETALIRPANQYGSHPASIDGIDGKCGAAGYITEPCATCEARRIMKELEK